MTERAIVHLTWGPQYFQKAVLAPGDVLRIGTAATADFVIRGDKNSAEAELRWDGTTGSVCVLGGADALILNGQAVTAGPLGHGEWFRLGESTFMLCRERAHPAHPAHLPPRAMTALATLRTGAAALYAVLDAARDDRILALLRESPNETRSLYEGVKGDAMAAVAPYLVHLDPQGWLLEALVAEGWGENWGVYLLCALPLGALRRHLRRFLRVKQEGSADSLYFRFYDPRVLRIFLPTCTPEQLDQLYGPIQKFWLEDSSAELLEQSHQSRAQEETADTEAPEEPEVI